MAICGLMLLLYPTKITCYHEIGFVTSHSHVPDVLFTTEDAKNLQCFQAYLENFLELIICRVLCRYVQTRKMERPDVVMAIHPR
jgi:hypothetical protein